MYMFINILSARNNLCFIKICQNHVNVEGWNDKVQEVIKAKKETKKMWETSRRQEDKDRYRSANKAAKKAVATTKALAMNELYEE